MLQLGILLIALFSTSLSQASELSGQLKTTVDSYPYHLGKVTEDLTPYLSFDLGQKHRLSRTWRTQWRVLALGNLAADGPPENLYADLPEAFVEWKQPDVRVRLGLNTLNWGVVDIMSPSDTVNTSAMFHPLRSFKQGAPMLETVLGPEAFNLDLIYIPVQRRPLLPSKNSRWLPRKFLLNVDPAILRVALPKTIEYGYSRPETLDHALNHNYGGKLAAHFGSLDLQLTHFEGASTMAKIRPTIDLVFDTVNGEWLAQTPISLAPVTYRVRTTGFGFVKAQERWILRGESAYAHTLSKDALLQPWSWASVLAVETNVEVGARTLTLLAQYFYTRNPQAADNLPSSSYRLFDQTGMLGGRLAYAESLTLIGSVLYESITHGTFWMVGMEQKLNDHLRFALSWRDFSAERDGLLKTFERNDHGTLELTYFF